ncbi:LPXTG cell wall anchor domain-containing protein [Bacillus infantis]|uniref:LPXTG cell wall anchor domain-containing protein n=1 Tax=Bacillus infantis TaxID=324767 RepID=UPI003CEB1A0D
MTNRLKLAKPKAIFMILTLFILTLFPTYKALAEDKEIDIHTNLTGYFFHVGDLKPGDWMPRDITIINNGKQDFKYSSIIGEKKSVKGLFEELELLVKKDSTILYEGKLKDFKGFTPRPLKKGQTETLFFQVTMPYELGNAFQNSSAEVEILFVAEALDGGGDPPDDGDPPGEDDPGDGEDPGEEDPGDNPGDEDPPGEDNPDDGDNGEDPGDGETEDPGEDNPSEDPGDDSDDPSHNPDEPASGNPGSDPGEGITVTPEIRENILPDTATNTYNFMLLGGILLGAGGILLAVRYHRIRKDH